MPNIKVPGFMVLKQKMSNVFPFGCHNIQSSAWNQHYLNNSTKFQVNLPSGFGENADTHTCTYDGHWPTGITLSHPVTAAHVICIFAVLHYKTHFVTGKLTINIGNSIPCLTKVLDLNNWRSHVLHLFLAIGFSLSMLFISTQSKNGFYIKAKTIIYSLGMTHKTYLNVTQLWLKSDLIGPF